MINQSYYQNRKIAYCAKCAKNVDIAELVNDNLCPKCHAVVRLRPRNNSARRKDPRPIAKAIKGGVY